MTYRRPIPDVLKKALLNACTTTNITYGSGSDSMVFVKSTDQVFEAVIYVLEQWAEDETLWPERTSPMGVPDSITNYLFRALMMIHRDAGKVCADYEICDHVACDSSYAAWAISDSALYMNMSALQSGEDLDLFRPIELEEWTKAGLDPAVYKTFFGTKGGDADGTAPGSSGPVTEQGGSP